jgi:hypothetical protein
MMHQQQGCKRNSQQQDMYIRNSPQLSAVNNTSTMDPYGYQIQSGYQFP